MIRHLLLATIISSVSLAAHGFTGPFLGIELGGGIFTGDHTYIDAAGKDKISFNKTGAILGGYVGYLKELGKSHTVIGIEGYLHTNATSIKDDLRTTSAKIKVGTFDAERTYSTGLALIGGKLINPKVMVFAKLSFEQSKFTIKYKNSLMVPTSLTRKKTVTSVIPGVGILHRVMDGVITPKGKLYAGFEYNFAGLFKDIKTRKTSQSISYKLSHTEHRIIAKLTYMI